MEYAKFKSKYIGTKQDYDGKYGYQCVDLVKLWANEGWKIKPSAVGHTGYAKEVFLYSDSMLSSKVVQRIANQPKLVPPQGAIIVFNSTPKNKIGHIAVVDVADLKSVTVLEQNGSTGNGTGKGNDAIRTKTYGYENVLGWLIPNAPISSGGVKDSGSQSSKTYYV